MNDILVHHGIKGQRWGVRRYQKKRQRRQDKLNRLATRQQLREDQYQFIDNYMRRKGPMAYARWYSSDSTAQQRRYIKYGQKRIARLLNKYGKEYSMTYDVMTGQYELKDLRDDELKHYGVKGMKWGVRKSDRAVFVSGSSKTQTKDSGYYRKKLPKDIQKALKRYMKEDVKVIVGDAPGIDRQVQDFLKRHRYKNVEVYGPGKQVRYSANKKWKTNPIDAPEFEPGSKEWLAKKDIAMEKAATEGLAIVLDEGAKATRKNVERLIANHKDVKVYQLNQNGKDDWVNERSSTKSNKQKQRLHDTRNRLHQIDPKGKVELDENGVIKLTTSDGDVFRIK